VVVGIDIGMCCMRGIDLGIYSISSIRPRLLLSLDMQALLPSMLLSLSGSPCSPVGALFGREASEPKVSHVNHISYLAIERKVSHMSLALPSGG
jgi:hypothetical protein